MARPAAQRREMVMIRPEDCKLTVETKVKTKTCDWVSHLRPVQATSSGSCLGSYAVTDLWPTALALCCITLYTP